MKSKIKTRQENNSLIKIPVAVVFLALILLAAPAFAACDNACNTESQYSCSLTTTTMAKSTSGTLTVSITNQQSQSVSSVSTTLQDLGWFTGTTTTSTISSLNSGASTSIDYTITPTSDGAQNVCVRLGSTCTADCSSITITSPASLSVTSLTTSSSSVSTSTSFTASATIYNSGTETAGSSTSITATLSSSSGCTVSSGTKTIGTLAGKETNSQSWTLTSGSSAATCTLTLSMSGSAGGSDSRTATVTVTAAASNATNATSTGGGGGGTTTNATAKETKAFSTLAGVSKLLTFTQVASTGLTEIDLKTISAKTGVQISAAAGSKPSGAPNPVTDGAVYSYLEITKTNVTDSDLSLVKIRFKVTKSWTTSNSIDSLKVALYRYTSGWDKLLTTQTSDDATYYYYEAISPGLSTFAVAGEKTTAPTPPSLTIVSPTSSATVGTNVEVVLSASGVRLAAPTGTVVDGEGHFHVWLDDANEKRGASTTFTFENVAPGTHTVKAELHKGDHTLYAGTTKTVTFTVSAAAPSGEAPAPPPTTEQPAAPGLPDVNTVIGAVILGLAILFGVVYHFLLKQRPKYNYRPVKQLYSDKSAAKSRYEYKPKR